MPDATTASESAVHAVAAPEAAQGEAHGAGAGAAHGGGHLFDFNALNGSHNYPYPAVEWIHGHPALILDAAAYAKTNFHVLSGNAKFASVTADAGYASWAKDVTSATGYQGPAEGELAKAMTLARDEAWLGAQPRIVSNLISNHQTFWSTIALTLFALALLVFAKRKKDQHLPANRFQHIIEVLVLFVRDEVVRPNLGGHDSHGDHGQGDNHAHPADAWTPFFASMFLAILACNLFGLVPLFGTATGSLGVTCAWASVTALLILFLGMRENGVVGFWASIVPVKLGPSPGAIIGFTAMLPLELLSLVSRPVILAIRLFANMFAGHMVLLVFTSLGFIAFGSAVQAGNPSVGLPVGLGVFGWLLTVPFYALEVLVSLIQAYIFTLLSAVFIGMYMHPEH